MPGILSPAHLIIILIIVLIAFGPGKLPDVAKSPGNAVRSFKDAVNNDKPEDQPSHQSDTNTLPKA